MAKQLTNSTNIQAVVSGSNLSLDFTSATQALINQISTNTQNITKLQTYSTDEVEIGTWFDGNPLYRKVIQTTVSNLQSVLNGLSFDSVVDIYGWYNSNYSYKWKINSYTAEANYRLTVYMNSAGTSFNVSYGSYVRSTDSVIAVIKYTKTS